MPCGLATGGLALAFIRGRRALDTLPYPPALRGLVLGALVGLRGGALKTAHLAVVTAEEDCSFQTAISAHEEPWTREAWSHRLSCCHEAGPERPCAPRCPLPTPGSASSFPTR